MLNFLRGVVAFVVFYVLNHIYGVPAPGIIIAGLGMLSWGMTALWE